MILDVTLKINQVNMKAFYPREKYIRSKKAIETVLCEEALLGDCSADFSLYQRLKVEPREIEVREFDH